MRYRQDIEGLRAVSIVTVVLFHAWTRLVPGGFIGVDVFFVISGFLISGIIAGELREGRFTLASFYERRIKRIFPALLFMLVVTGGLSYLLLAPEALAEFGRTVVSTTLFVSNMEFLALSGYFNGPAGLKPLLHTWSLAVEEQFYIVFPLLLIALWRWFRAGVTWVVALCAAASLAGSMWAVVHEPDAAFYLAPLRAYELLLGALLSLGALPNVRVRWLREALAATGLALIVGSAFVFTSKTPFPGVNALVPCLGACLIIAAGSAGSSGVATVLSLRPVRFVGGISYSLYLWHWPLLVFAKEYFFNELTPTIASAAVTAAVVMAVVSRKFIERPFLDRGPRGAWLFGQAAAAMGGVAALGLVATLSGGLPERFPAEALRMFRYAGDFNPRRTQCQAEDGNIIAFDRTCRFGAAVPPSVAIWGDSHGAELALVLGELANRHGVSVRQITWAGCPPSLGFERTKRPACARHNIEIFDRLRGDPGTTDVVMVAHYDLYSDWPSFMAGISRAAEGLAAAGKRVTIVYPVPTLHFSAPQALGMLVFWGRSRAHLTIPRREFDQVNARTIAALDVETARIGARRVIPANLLCDAIACRAFADGASLYFDNNHLSLTAARRLVDTSQPLASLWGSKNFDMQRTN